MDLVYFLGWRLLKRGSKQRIPFVVETFTMMKSVFFAKKGLNLLTVFSFNAFSLREIGSRCVLAFEVTLLVSRLITHESISALLQWIAYDNNLETSEMLRLLHLFGTFGGSSRLREFSATLAMPTIRFWKTMPRTLECALSSS